jgi:predicted ATP-dependent endonuclease of OLD family
MTPYFKSITLKNYRGFLNTEIAPLRRINVIGGINGVGKTSLLEAIFTLIDGHDPTLMLRHAIFRNYTAEFAQEAKRFFYNENTDQIITLQADTRPSDKKRTALLALKMSWEDITLTSPANISSENALNLPPTTYKHAGIKLTFFFNQMACGTLGLIATGSGGYMKSDLQRFTADYQPPNGSFITPSNRYVQADLAERFTHVIRAGKLAKLIDALQLVQPGLKNLQILQVANQSLIHGTTESGMLLPLNLMGDGVVTLAAIVMNMLHAENGVMLLDEFDAAIHYSIMTKIWAIILRLANEWNVQLFVSTHSRECIKAAHEAFESTESQDDLSFIRLDRKKNNITPTIYDFRQLKEAIELDWEIR